MDIQGTLRYCPQVCLLAEEDVQYRSERDRGNGLYELAAIHIPVDGIVESGSYTRIYQLQPGRESSTSLHQGLHGADCLCR